MTRVFVIAAALAAAIPASAQSLVEPADSIRDVLGREKRSEVEELPGRAIRQFELYLDDASSVITWHGADRERRALALFDALNRNALDSFAAFKREHRSEKFIRYRRVVGLRIAPRATN